MKIFEKKFQWERIFEKPLDFCEFSPDFQSESCFDFTKDRRIETRGSLQCIEKNVLTPLPNHDIFFGFSRLDGLVLY